MSRRIGSLLLGVAGLVLPIHAPPAIASPAPCVLKAATIPARQIIDCIKARQNVDLTNVVVNGNLDFSEISALRLGGKNLQSSRVAAIKRLVDESGLDRSYGNFIEAARPVWTNVVLRDSTLKGDITSFKPSPTRYDAFTPVVFLGRLVIQGTTVTGSVEMSQTIFADVVAISDSDVGTQFSMIDARFRRDVSFADNKLANVVLERSIIDGDVTLETGKRCPSREDPRKQPGPEPQGMTSFNFERAELLRNFKMVGKETDDCIKRLNFNRARFAGGIARFEHVAIKDGDFSNAEFAERPQFVGGELGTADFSSVRFRSGAIFDRTHFVGRARFLRAYFGDAKATSFSGASFDLEGAFPESIFLGPVDFSIKRASALDLSSALFAKDMSMARAEVKALNLAGAVFNDRATFRQNRLGSAVPIEKDARVDIDLEGVRFDADTVFDENVYLSPLNLSHLTFAPGKLRFKWEEQLEGRVRSAALRYQYPGLPAMTAAPGLAEPEAEVFARLSKNYDATSELAAANSTLFLAKQAKESRNKRVSDYNYRAPMTVMDEAADFAIGCRDARFSECVWGYAVRPLRTLFWLLVLITVVAVAAKVSRVRLVGDAHDLGWPALKLAELPVSGEAIPHKGSGNRWLACYVFAVALVTALSPGNVQMVRPKWRTGFALLTIAVRCIGLLLVGALVVALAHAVPVAADVAKYLTKGAS